MGDLDDEVTQLPQAQVIEHDSSPYLGLAVLILSILNLDSEFDPATFSQLAGLIATIMSGVIGAFFLVRKKNNGTKTDSESKKAADFIDRQ